MVIQRAECWCGAGRGQCRPPAKKKFCYIDYYIFCYIYYTMYRIIIYFIQCAECWWGAGRGLGRGQRPLPHKKIFAIYIIIYFAIYIIPRIALAILTPSRSPLAVSKSYFFTSHVFSGVHLFAYRFRRLWDGFRP